VKARPCQGASSHGDGFSKREVINLEGRSSPRGSATIEAQRINDFQAARPLAKGKRQRANGKEGAKKGYHPIDGYR